MRFFDTHAHIGLINEDPIEQMIIAQEAEQENDGESFFHGEVFF